MFYISPKDVCVGIDIGSNTIRLIKIKRGRHINVMKAAKVFLPQDLIQSGFMKENISDKKTFQDKVLKLFQEANINEKEILVNIPDSCVRTFFLHLENVPSRREEAKEFIQWKLKKETIPGLDKDFIIDYEILKKDKVGDKVSFWILVVAINKNILAEYEVSLSQMGLKPIKITPSFFGLANYFYFFSEEDKKENIAIINLGHQTSTILIFRDRELDFIRSFNIGGRDFTSQIKDNFSLNWEEAEKKKMENIFFPEDIENIDISRLIGTNMLDNFNSIRSTQSSLYKEIADSFQHYEKETHGCKIEKIFLSGGTANFRNIDLFFKKIFHLETIRINNLKRINLIHGLSNNEILTYASALGVLL